MTHYDAGRRFEWKVRTDLRGHGYEVMRMAGSRGAADLVAVRPGRLLFVQCKLDGALPGREWDHLLTLALHVNAAPILAVNGPRGRGVVYVRLLGPHRARKGFVHQNAEPYELD